MQGEVTLVVICRQQRPKPERIYIEKQLIKNAS